MPPQEVAGFADGRVVVYAPGGTSRWYFLEYGDVAQGYGREEHFRDYARRSLGRIVEQVGMMCADGIYTVLVVGFVSGQDARTEDYNRNVAQFFHFLTDSETRQVYDLHGVGVQFRGVWQDVARRLGRDDVLDDMRTLEQDTNDRPSQLVWLTSDDRDVVPASLMPSFTRYYAETGEVMTREALCELYYGRQMSKVDIFLGHNKLSLANLIPPLMMPGDLYFSVTPSLYMNPEMWRAVLYDHLFARHGHFRDYGSILPSAVEELRAFYQDHQGVIFGVGDQHEASQTWRPRLVKASSDQAR